ncbi:MAG TPA: FixH family protein [Candidatus Binatia bacterium]|jgi:hypothetical protein
MSVRETSDQGQNDRDPRPWYRQFWPWFLVALPAASVILSISTLIVAIRHADVVLHEDAMGAVADVPTRPAVVSATTNAEAAGQAAHAAPPTPHPRVQPVEDTHPPSSR